ncbi:alkaline shock response membrane anchor protein AmaP [Chengkuizengella sediminis]|uniref:alkaline shock response membrane anchor protein AmaP n=1 Tax=Chengkuizengella sediminis TaxID=1885917 RepID=UPI001478DAF9|nr:alkaline shock response membrane anchor protein AmaP [Chengkuizengella sediminis]
MKILDRLLLFLYSVFVTVVSLAVLIQVIQTGDIIVPSLNDTQQIILYSTVAVVVLISIRFLYITLRSNRSSKPSIDQRNDYGDIKISMETIEQVALKAAARVKGIKDTKAKITANQSGIEVKIKTYVDGETAIPKLTEEIQQNVNDYIEDVTGIPVSNVSVLVVNIFQSNTFKSRVE